MTDQQSRNPPMNDEALRELIYDEMYDWNFDGKDKEAAITQIIAIIRQSLLMEIAKRAPTNYDTRDLVSDDISDPEYGGHRRGFNRSNRMWRKLLKELAE